VDSLLLLAPWLVLGIPIVTAVRWAELRRKQKVDYSHYVERKEFPLSQLIVGKFVFFSAIGLGSVFDPAPPEKTLVALFVIGVCGFAVEGTFVLGRPVPTKGYQMTRTTCANCSIRKHEDCTNMRMLDGFEKGFKSEEGHRRPVCCCGFRLGDWEEIEV
jgi:hypothetical protein